MYIRWNKINFTMADKFQKILYSIINKWSFDEFFLHILEMVRWKQQHYGGREEIILNKEQVIKKFLDLELILVKIMSQFYNPSAYDYKIARAIVSVRHCIYVRICLISSTYILPLPIPSHVGVLRQGTALDEPS